MALISELCNIAKSEKHVTHQDISEKTNIPVSTIANFFSKASKAPSVYTVGPICAALGVSLDKYFGIIREEDPEMISELEKRCRDSELKLEHSKEIIALKDDTIRNLRREVEKRRPVILSLIAIVAALVALFILYFICFDLRNPEFGIFRG